MGSASPVQAHAMDSGSEHAVAVPALCGASRYALAQEGHKEAEADEDHHMDVLIEWVVLRDCNVRTLTHVCCDQRGSGVANPTRGVAPLRDAPSCAATFLGMSRREMVLLRARSECISVVGIPGFNGATKSDVSMT